MKSFAKVALTILFLIGFVCLFGEAKNPNLQLIWSLGSMAVCYLSAKGLDKLGAFNE